MTKYYKITVGNFCVGYMSEEYVLKKFDERVLTGKAECNLIIGEDEVIDVEPVDDFWDKIGEAHILGYDTGYWAGRRDYEKKWIPVTEQLPEKEKRTYWVCTDTGYQCQCRWTNNIFGIGESDEWGWSIADVPQYHKVTAWMLLPEPYEPLKEDEDE